MIANYERCTQSRYTGNVGDVVVGRITEVGNKLWKVDVNARQEALLPIGSVNLPGGAQRRRTIEDRLQMRQLFAENDVISCEIATVKSYSAISVQTRSMKYGKLENGQMLTVPPSLVKRVRKHFVTLRCGVDVVLGHNGYIWLTASVRKPTSDAADSDEMELEEQEEAEAEANVAEVERSRLVTEMEDLKASHKNRTISGEERLRIARVANSIHILADAMMLVMPKTIEAIYEASISIAPRPSEMLIPLLSAKILEAVDMKGTL
jgi:exosome complex component RRP4